MYKINNTPPKDILSVIPKDEEIIWHGRPDLRRFCLTAIGIKYILVYLIVITCSIIYTRYGDFNLITILQVLVPYLLSCCLAIILLVIVGISQVLPTVYVITSKRVIIKSGLALIFMLNVPFDKIASIDKNNYSDGSGNISFKLISNKRVPFFASWPSVRPWYFSNPEPTFRCIADVDVIALKISEAAQSRVSEVNLKKTNDIKNVKMQDGGITA